MKKLCCHAVLNEYCLMSLDTKPVSFETAGPRNIFRNVLAALLNMHCWAVYSVRQALTPVCR